MRICSRLLAHFAANDWWTVSSHRTLSPRKGEPNNSKENEGFTTSWPLRWNRFLKRWPFNIEGSSPYQATKLTKFITLRPRQNGRHFPDDIFKWIFLNENVWISINISLKVVPRAPINNIPTLVQVMAWRRPGDKPLSELMMVRLPTHICVTRPQWVKAIKDNDN